MVEVKKDPRLEMTQADHETRREELLKLQSLESQTNETINSCKFLSEQLGLLKKQAMKGEESTDKALVTQIEDALKGVDIILNDLQRPPPNMGYRQKPRLREEIRSLMFAIGETSSKPTASQEKRVVQVGEEAVEIFNAFDAFISSDINDINKKLEGKPVLKTGIKPKRS